MRLMYSVKTERSIMVPHRDKNGVETLVAYVFSKVLIPPMGVGEESITIEIFASSDYKMHTTDIQRTLRRMDLEVKGDVHQPNTMAQLPHPYLIQ